MITETLHTTEFLSVSRIFFLLNIHTRAGDEPIIFDVTIKQHLQCDMLWIVEHAG